MREGRNWVSFGVCEENEIYFDRIRNIKPFSHINLSIMAFSKAHRFRQTDFHFSLVCHALAHPARISIIRTLYEQQKCSVNVLNSGMPISPASLSQHLKILREMHILQCEEKYPTVYYWINTDLADTSNALIDMIHSIGEYFPTTREDEIDSIGRRRGPVRPE